MAQLIRFAATEAVIRDAGMQLRQLFWNEDVRNRSQNLLISSDAFEEGSPVEQNRNSASAHFCGEFVEYRGTRWLRPDRASLGYLLGFLESLLGLWSDQELILLTYNDNESSLQPDPWIPEWIETQERDERAMTTLAELGIDKNTRGAVQCRLPADLPIVLILANWYFTRQENLYLFCSELGKIVICHERDLHVCSLDSQYSDQVRLISSKCGVHVAPFDSQQCA